MELAELKLNGNADAVEFCPHDPYNNILAAATYTLEEGECASRSGSISLFNIDTDSGRFELIQEVETVGIFDIKWSPVVGNSGYESRPLLAHADASGFLKIYDLQHSDCIHELGGVLRDKAGQEISSSMCLCLGWNQTATAICVGHSDGSVSVVSLSESKTELLQQWKAHDFEVWAASFDIHQPHLVYTGSDDCKFKCWDLRDKPSNLVFSNSKVHTMGICCIAKSPGDDNTLLTGSYDEYLRVWDMRTMSKPVNRTSVCLGGGVWRIKHHPCVDGVVLAACMHNGFAILRMQEENCEVIETYDKHGSLAYGADWQRGKLSEKGTVVATCSFYDRLLRIWIPQKQHFT